MRTPRASCRNHWRRLAPVCLALWLAGVACAGAAEPDSRHAERKREISSPPALTVRLDDDRQLRGRLVAFSPVGFDLTDADGQTHFVRWPQLPPRRVFLVQRRLLARDDARGWLQLGITLRAMEHDEAEQWSDRALERAERLDASLAEHVERVRAGERVTLTPESDQRREPRRNDEAQEALDVATAGPRTVGEAQQRHWGALDPETHREAIRRLDAFAREGAARIDADLQRHETRFFLLYTDLTRTETRRWIDLMDRMYVRLANLFGVPEGENIWHGKCLVVIFRRADDYHAFERTVHGHPAPGTAGRCWTFGNGDVHITFYRQSNPFRFAHVLVHEAVHGFLHRYRSPARIPSWLNEGLADTIARELVPEDRTVDHRQRLAVNTLRRRAPIGDFFETPQIEPWQYGLASDLTEFMLRHDKARYVQLIDGIKAGKTWRESLADSFDATPRQLIATWAASHDLDDVHW